MSHKEVVGTHDSIKTCFCRRMLSFPGFVRIWPRLLLYIQLTDSHPSTQQRGGNGLVARILCSVGRAKLVYQYCCNGPTAAQLRSSLALNHLQDCHTDHVEGQACN